MSIALKLHTVATFYEISLIVTIMSHGIIFIMSYRADTFLRRGTGDVSMIEESQNLSLFLANQNKITLLLKEGLEHIQGYEDVLADVLNMFVRLFESNMYITPNEKHVLLKVCLYFHIVAQDVVQVKMTSTYKKVMSNLSQFQSPSSSLGQCTSSSLQCKFHNQQHFLHTFLGYGVYHLSDG